MATAFIGLGSNLNYPKQQLHLALRQLKRHPDIKLFKLSSFYSSSPIGGVVQDDFINAVCQVETSLSANELLELLQYLELSQGRTREVRWGPRSLDLDLLYYDQQSITEDNLIVPHPEIMNRQFVVTPLLEIVKKDFYLYQELQQAQLNLATQQLTKLPFETPYYQDITQEVRTNPTGSNLILWSVISSIVIIALTLLFLMMLFI